MTTGVPHNRSGFRRWRAAEPTRTHPALTDLPMELGLFVPWMASRLPQQGSLVWMPEMPKTKAPYDRLVTPREDVYPVADPVVGTRLGITRYGDCD